MLFRSHPKKPIKNETNWEFQKQAYGLLSLRSIELKPSAQILYHNPLILARIRGHFSFPLLAQIMLNHSKPTSFNNNLPESSTFRRISSSFIYLRIEHECPQSLLIRVHSESVLKVRSERIFRTRPVCPRSGL